MMFPDIYFPVQVIGCFINISYTIYIQTILLLFIYFPFFICTHRISIILFHFHNRVSFPNVFQIPSVNLCQTYSFFNNEFPDRPFSFQISFEFSYFTDFLPVGVPAFFVSVSPLIRFVKLPPPTSLKGENLLCFITSNMSL